MSECKGRRYCILCIENPFLISLNILFSLFSQQLHCIIDKFNFHLILANCYNLTHRHIYIWVINAINGINESRNFNYNQSVAYLSDRYTAYCHIFYIPLTICILFFNGSIWAAVVRIQITNNKWSI